LKQIELNSLNIKIKLLYFTFFLGMLSVSTMHTQETVELEIEMVATFNGIYFLKVSYEEQQKSYKIIINK